MMLIKVLLVLSFLGLTIWGLRNRNHVGMRASVRLVGLVLVAAAIASVLDPGITQDLADFVGVTRGTDLVLYVLVVVFMATSTSMYFRFKDLERKLAAVVRAQAIEAAKPAREQTHAQSKLDEAS